MFCLSGRKVSSPHHLPLDALRKQNTINIVINQLDFYSSRFDFLTHFVCDRDFMSHSAYYYHHSFLLLAVVDE